MTANEWLGVMKQAQDFPKGMEKLIVKYGEMLIAEHESKVKKLTIPDVSKRILLIIINLNTMDVKIKDRKEEIEFLRMACNMAELGIGYQHADLIIRLQERLKKLKGKFSISDGVEIHYKWKQDWQNYFDEQSKTQDAS